MLGTRNERRAWSYGLISTGGYWLGMDLSPPLGRGLVGGE